MDTYAESIIYTVLQTQGFSAPLSSVVTPEEPQVTTVKILTVAEETQSLHDALLDIVFDVNQNLPGYTISAASQPDGATFFLEV